MRVARKVAFCVLVVVYVTCAAAPDKPAAQPKPTLWESDRSVLFPALREFVHSPGTRPDRAFMTVEKKEGELLFKGVPDAWFTWKDGKSEGRVLVLDQDGFRVLIGLEQVPDVEKALVDHIQYGQGHHSVVLIDHWFTPGGVQVSRVVKCEKLKGDTNFIEYRYFEARHGAVCVKLTVFDAPEKKRTLDDLLVHLRSHYGKYQGVCQQVADLVVNKP
jgi:hypothetical protein